MKFTKEDAYKDLVAKLTTNGEKLNLSERSINEQLETLIPLVANEETEMSDFIEKTIAFFKTANANVRNDVSAGINEYKKNNPPTLPPVEPIKKTAEGGDDELVTRLEALERQLADANRKNTIAEIKTNLVAKIKEKGVEDDEWIDNFISEINITEDFNIEEKAERYVGVYNKMNARVNKSVTPKTGGGNGGNDYINDVVKQAAAFAKSQNLID